MDQQQEPTFEESVKQVMQTLPPPIREYLSQGNYSVVAKNLMRKYTLHIDQGGVLEREIMLLLMGIDSPEEFSKSLKEEAKVSEDVMRSIMTDINQEIFIPLQKEMRNGGQVQKSNIVTQTSKLNAPAPRYISPTTTPPPTTSPNNAPLPPKMAMPLPKSVSTVTARPPLQMLPIGEEERKRISNIAPGSLVQPPINLPGTMPPIPVPSSTLPKTQPHLASLPQRPATPSKPYLTDPYREPPE
jgi:hypothetical protein